jgi:hypothetical protein
MDFLFDQHVAAGEPLCGFRRVYPQWRAVLELYQETEGRLQAGHLQLAVFLGY